MIQVLIPTPMLVLAPELALLLVVGPALTAKLMCVHILVCAHAPARGGTGCEPIMCVAVVLITPVPMHTRTLSHRSQI